MPSENAAGTGIAPRPSGGWFFDPKHGFCKALAGHRWQQLPGLERPERNQLAVNFECDNCETVRHDIVDLTNGKVEHNYSYPKGYILKLAQGQKRPDKSTLRLAYVNEILLARRRGRSAAA